MLKGLKASKKDYPNLAKIWNRSVVATHKFLKSEDKNAIQKELPNYFDQVDLIKWEINKQIIGFSGTSGTELVMLFLDPDYFRHGYGHHIMEKLIKSGINKVSVNEQNNGAFKFYKRHGFKIVSASDLDSDGRLYPILNLQLGYKR